MTLNSKSRTLLTILLLLSLAGVSTSAQKPKKTDPCADPQTQVEMTQCAANAYKAADAVLNQIYKQMVAKLDEEGKGPAQRGPERLAKVPGRELRLRGRSV
jgi:uncharacterized protein YecT (DUF1311 family)